MIDYLSSKFVWIIVSIVVTSSVLGVFTWQRERTEELELDRRANMITETVDALLSTDSEFRAHVSFENEKSSFIHLEPTMNGEKYELIFTPSHLIVNQAQWTVHSRFMEEIYLLDPYFLGDDTASLARSQTRLEIDPDTDFIIESRTMGERSKVFVYPVQEDDFYEDLENIQVEIDDFFAFNPLEEPVNASFNTSFSHPLEFRTDHFSVMYEGFVPVPIPVLEIEDPLAVPEEESVTFERNKVWEDENLTIERSMFLSNS